MITAIKSAGIALLLAALAFPAAAADGAEGESRETAQTRAEQARELRELERELREARRAFRSAARRMQELQARLMAEQAEARELREESIRAGLRSGNKARLGVVVDPTVAPHTSGSGAEIVAVTPGSPAETAGLQPGDVIFSMNGNELEAADRHGEGHAAAELIRRARALSPGDEVSLGIRRDGSTMIVTLRAEAADWRPRWIVRQNRLPAPGGEFWPYALLDSEDPDDETRKKWMEFEMVALTPELGKYFGSDKGVLVIRAPKDPPLDVKVGDVIIRIGEEALSTPLEAVRTLRSFEPGKKVDVKLLRDRNVLTVQAEVPALRTLHFIPAEEKKDD